MDELNNELEEMMANDMAYNFTREIMINDEYNLKLIETIKRYGLSEKICNFNANGNGEY